MRYLKTKLVFLCGALALVGCKVVNNNNATVKASDLRITTDIGNWSEVAGTYHPFSTTDELTMPPFGIDGQVVPYENKGLVNGIYQELKSGAGYDYQVYVMDFGTDSAATAIFNDIVAGHVTTPAAISGYVNTVAVAQDNVSQAVVYAHIKNFYFWITLSSYSAIITNATNAAGTFLDKYKFKIGA
ncbi:MAG: hypothetical protein PHC61_11615 [Chitinivibrionales bacterium]|nr:hypothetical protein [Chitinivibrionales bacterium]